MAAAQSRDDLDWMMRTFAPPRLAAWGMTAEATALTSAPPIVSDPRMNNAAAYLEGVEASIWADYVPGWEQYASQTESIVDEFIAALPDAITGIMADADTAAKGLLKAFIRTLMIALNRHLFLAG